MITTFNNEVSLHLKKNMGIWWYLRISGHTSLQKSSQKLGGAKMAENCRPKISPRSVIKTGILAGGHLWMRALFTLWSSSLEQVGEGAVWDKFVWFPKSLGHLKFSSMYVFFTCFFQEIIQSSDKGVPPWLLKNPHLVVGFSSSVSSSACFFFWKGIKKLQIFWRKPCKKRTKVDLRKWWGWFEESILIMFIWYALRILFFKRWYDIDVWYTVGWLEESDD